jgi:hypothetical protein
MSRHRMLSCRRWPLVVFAPVFFGGGTEVAAQAGSGALAGSW